tara:strand:- start:731 stop:1261 length:531 start_codon:yes stop_codon:yes gene_type:complete
MKIAISGPMASGKTTVANLIKNEYPYFNVFSFGKKVKDIAGELFDMDENTKNRSLLINIADKMREIDIDVWAKYIINQTDKEEFCIIDDLRFQNELNLLQKDWVFIILYLDENKRLERLKELYSDNYNDHIKNMNHLSELGILNFNDKKVIHINSGDSLINIKYNIKYFIDNLEYE